MYAKFLTTHQNKKKERKIYFFFSFVFVKFILFISHHVNKREKKIKYLEKPKKQTNQQTLTKHANFFPKSKIIFSYFSFVFGILRCFLFFLFSKI